MREVSSDLTPQESYLQQLFPTEMHRLLDQARAASTEVGKAGISLGAQEARLVATLVRSHGCRKFVEIGTLTGASALWILQGLQNGGKLWTLEKDPKHAQIASDILAQYKDGEKQVELIRGDAQETLKTLNAQGPFDGLFIDGNKSAYGAYLDWAEQNLEKGALIIADNVFLGGSVFTGNKAQFSKKQIEVMREFNRRLADPQKYLSSILPTGEGLFVAVKLF
ncbi:MAG: O-methyltransferase [Bdellovibrio sp. CG10_big_fil_rev_8_21_14_0_10_47_8]|nr:MAG: O-methyltransferase [Bdellovibrio sp. CG10_big_fil_rev_8_21_14_0_10_47_8]